MKTWLHYFSKHEKNEKCFNMSLSLSLKKMGQWHFNEALLCFIKCRIVIDIFISYLFKIAAKAKHSFSTMEWEYSKENKFEG